MIKLFQNVFGLATKLSPAGLALSVLPWAAGAGVVLSAWLYVSHLRSQVSNDETMINQVVAVNQANTAQLDILKQDQAAITAEDAKLNVVSKNLQLIASEGRQAIDSAANSSLAMTPGEQAVLTQVQSYQGPEK